MYRSSVKKILDLGRAGAILMLLYLPPGMAQEPCGVVDIDGLEPAVAETVSLAADGFRALEAPTAADYGGIAMLLHAHALHDAAAVCYRLAGLADPAELRWAHLAGVVAEELGDVETASQHYLSALRAEPTFFPAASRLAAALRRQGDIGAASLVLTRFAVPDAPAVVHAALGEQALAEERHAQAIAHLEAALAAQPEANRLHYLLGQAYRRTGDVEQAQQHLQASGSVGLVANDPLMAEVQQLAAGEIGAILQGRRAFNAGDMEAAAAAFEEALQRNPDSIEARVNLATSLSNLGEQARAIEAFRQVIERDPDNRAALFNLAALQEARDPEAAIERYQRLVTLDATDTQAHHRLGRLLAMRGDSEAAIEHLQTARGDLRLFVPASLDLARILSADGKEGEAITLLKEARAVVPSDPELVAELIRLQASARDRSVRDGEAALALARQMHQAMEDSRSARLMALSYAELERCADAKAWLIQAVELSDNEEEKKLLRAFRERLADDCRPR